MNLGLFSILGIVFIILKLVGTIDWSWWLVLLPIYGPAIFWFIIIYLLALTKEYRK